MADVQQLVQSSFRNSSLRRALAKSMAEMLSSSSPNDWKNFFCEQLSLLGTREEVPYLAQILNDSSLGFHGRFALERIPGSASDRAIRDAAAGGTGLPLTGVVNTAGERKDPRAVDLLGRRLGETTNSSLRGAAIHALGKIGGADAVRFLMSASQDGSPPLRLLRDEALLRCAEAFESSGALVRGAEIYDSLSSPGGAPHIRAAAFAGALRCRPEMAAAMVLDALRSKDETLHSAVLRVLREPGGKAIAPLAAEHSDLLPVARRSQVFYALADLGEHRALPAMYKALSRDRSLRTAALYGIGRLGDSSSVERLCGRIDKSKTTERAEITESLTRLKGPGVDERLLALLSPRSSIPVKKEAISAIATRGYQPALPALIEAAHSDKGEVRKASLNAIGSLADGAVIDELVGMLKSDRSEAERPSIVKALVRLGQRDQTPERVCNTMISEFPGSPPSTRVSLLRVLGEFGGTKAFETVQYALADPNPSVRRAAIQVLSAWPDSTPLAELFMLAHAPGEAGTRLLALRGGVSLLEKSVNLKEVDRMKIIERELQRAKGSEPRRLLLSALGKQTSIEALRLAASYLGEKGVADEAALAVAGIAPATGKEYFAETQKTLENAVKSTKSKNVRKQVRTHLADLKPEGTHRRINVAVVTGGHEFDASDFLALFRQDTSLAATHIPLADESEIFEDISNWPYDVIVLYNMTQKISERRRMHFLRLLDKGVGLLSLHHASAAFQEWSEFAKIIGCKYLLAPLEQDGVRREASTYRHDVDIPVHVVGSAHHVTSGVGDFTVHDETYKGCTFEPDNQVLLTTTETSSDAPLGWARSYRRSRIVHLQLGHGPSIFSDKQFRRLVGQAIHWCAEKNPDSRSDGGAANGR